MDAQIERIKARIAHLHYRIDPPLSEQEIAEFERKSGIRLPQEYRTFLLEVGTLVSLEKGVQDVDYRVLSKPFPLTETSGWSEGIEELADWHGSLIVFDYGCAQTVLLITAGPERGNIWMDLTTNDGPIYPVPDPRVEAWNDEMPFPGSVDAPRIGFLTWFEAWLDSLIPGFDAYVEECRQKYGDIP
jgi:hypothetical protein